MKGREVVPVQVQCQLHGQASSEYTWVPHLHPPYLHIGSGVMSALAKAAGGSTIILNPLIPLLPPGTASQAGAMQGFPPLLRRPLERGEHHSSYPIHTLSSQISSLLWLL